MYTDQVLIPDDHWTAVREKVFKTVLPNLSHRLSPVLYLILYDRYYHSSGPVRATVAELARKAKMNVRSVSKCLSELEQKGLIKRVRPGKLHSRTRKPAWRVPAAKFTLAEYDWVAVPRFLIRSYCRRFHNAVLLLYLVWIHQWKFKPYCWIGVPGLAKRTRWSETRTFRALHIMGHRHVWDKQHTGLPWPVEITYKGKGKKARRRFKVRALVHKEKTQTVKLAPAFAQRFDVK